MRVFSLTIATDVLRLVDDDRDASEVATRMGGSNGGREMKSMKSRQKHLPAMRLGHCPSARPLLLPFVRRIHSWHLSPSLPLYPRPQGTWATWRERERNIMLCFYRHGKEYHVGSVTQQTSHVVSVQQSRLFTCCACEGPLLEPLCLRHSLSAFLMQFHPVAESDATRRDCLWPLRLQPMGSVSQWWSCIETSAS